MKIGLQMLFKLMPALLKCDVVLIVPDAILDGHLPIILGVGFGLDFGPRFWGSSVRGFACIWAFSGFGVLVGTCFWPTFGSYFCPYFPALENLTIDSAAPKLLGRYFGHPR